jgi:hypothetical protein
VPDAIRDVIVAAVEEVFQLPTPPTTVAAALEEFAYAPSILEDRHSVASSMVRTHTHTRHAHTPTRAQREFHCRPLTSSAAWVVLCEHADIGAGVHHRVSLRIRYIP